MGQSTMHKKKKSTTTTIKRVLSLLLVQILKWFEKRDFFREEMNANYSLASDRQMIGKLELLQPVFIWYFSDGKSLSNGRQFSFDLLPSSFFYFAALPYVNVQLKKLLPIKHSHKKKEKKELSLIVISTLFQGEFNRSREQTTNMELFISS